MRSLIFYQVVSNLQARELLLKNSTVIHFASVLYAIFVCVAMLYAFMCYFHCLLLLTLCHQNVANCDPHSILQNVRVLQFLLVLHSV